MAPRSDVFFSTNPRPRPWICKRQNTKTVENLSVVCESVVCSLPAPLLPGEARFLVPRIQKSGAQSQGREHRNAGPGKAKITLTGWNGGISRPRKSASCLVGSAVPRHRKCVWSTKKPSVILVKCSDLEHLVCCSISRGRRGYRTDLVKRRVEGRKKRRGLRWRD